MSGARRGEERRGECICMSEAEFPFFSFFWIFLVYILSTHLVSFSFSYFFFVWDNILVFFFFFSVLITASPSPLFWNELFSCNYALPFYYYYNFFCF